MQESAYDQHAMVRKCGIGHAKYNETDCVFIDVGIAQINYKTIIRYDFTVHQIMHDLEYAVNAGAEVLSWFRENYSQKEPDRWWARYNCGTGKWNSKCQTYIKLVSRYK